MLCDIRVLGEYLKHLPQRSYDENKLAPMRVYIVMCYFGNSSCGPACMILSCALMFPQMFSTI